MSTQGITGHWKDGYLGWQRCGRKKLFVSEQKALKSARRVSLKSGEPFIYYRCLDCTGWHIAHEESNR